MPTLATRQRTTPTTLTLSDCMAILQPLSSRGHILCRKEGDHNWWTVLLVRRPGRIPSVILGSGRTQLAAYRQAAERVTGFGAERVLRCW